jgi:hypothetical protein
MNAVMRNTWVRKRWLAYRSFSAWRRREFCLKALAHHWACVASQRASLYARDDEQEGVQEKDCGDGGFNTHSLMAMYR